MKLLLGFIILFSSIEAFTEQVKVSAMSPDGEMDRSFVLTTSFPEKVVLDCQSFIQGLRIGEQEQATFFIMDPNDCEGMQNRVHNSLILNQLHCIDVDQDILSDDTCS